MTKASKIRILLIVPSLIVGIALLFFLLHKSQTKIVMPKVEQGKKVNFLVLRNKWEEIIKNAVDEKKLYNDFKRSVSGVSVSDAHFSAHIFGELLFDRWGERAILICDIAYEYGCYHGVAVEAISRKGTSVVPNFIQACKQLANSNSNNLVSPCVHGIGHGLVEFFGHHEDKLLTSLKACTTNELLINRTCYSGVFMEYNVPILVADTKVSVSTRPLIVGKEYAPCLTIPQAYQPACYEQISQWWPGFFNNDIAKVGELCSKVELDENKLSCYRGIGDFIAMRSSFRGINVKVKCERISSEEGQFQCKDEAFGVLFYHPQKPVDIGRICNGLPKDKKEICLDS